MECECKGFFPSLPLPHVDGKQALKKHPIRALPQGKDQRLPTYGYMHVQYRHRGRFQHRNPVIQRRLNEIPRLPKQTAWG